jgi:putative glutamine amidotransferase
MPRPIIVLTAGRNNLTPAAGEVQSAFTGCDLCYVDAIVRAGGAPVLLPRHDDSQAVRAVIEIADGVLFTGGGDVSSLAYGQEPHPKLARQDPIRDSQEIEAARIAIGRDIPILGICRGLLLLNVALGGSLIQDIPTQSPASLLHYSHAAAPLAVHSIDIEPGSILAKLHNSVELPVNSYHHQAIDRLGDGLRINARARDLMVEGIEFADGKPLLAVQYHPEELAASDSRFQIYFDWLVAQAREYLTRKTEKADRKGAPNGHKN